MFGRTRLAGQTKGARGTAAATALGDAQLRQRHQTGTLEAFLEPPAATALGDAQLRQRADRLQQMFVSHHGMVWRTLRRRGLTADAAADITQQTFLIAAERLADIQPDSERAFLVPWTKSSRQKLLPMIYWRHAANRKAEGPVDHLG